jgi:alpha-ketoglutarate-dependent taurine dioxygenase
LVGEHRVLILRGFGKLHGPELSRFCERLGALQVFEFGAVDELLAKEHSRNFIFTTAAVPFHWDGMFLEGVPSFQFFSCEEAPLPTPAARPSSATRPGSSPAPPPPPGGPGNRSPSPIAPRRSCTTAAR